MFQTFVIIVFIFANVFFTPKMYDNILKMHDDYIAWKFNRKIKRLLKNKVIVADLVRRANNGEFDIDLGRFNFRIRR